MSKLFKKSLAFCVAIAMVFTLFAGTISVNAEDAEKTLTVTLEVTNTTVEDGAAQVTFPLAVTCSGDTSINALLLVITTTAGKVSNVVSAAETDDYTISYNGDRALLNAGTEVDSLGGFTTANLSVTVDLNEGLDKEAYDITIDCRSENASDANENALKISYETGYIRLLAHTHELTYTYDANGHWQVCTSDYCEVEGGYTTEVAAHVWENDGDPVYTDCVSNGTQAQICLCGATQTITVDPKGHNFVDGKCVCGAEDVTECTHAYDEADGVNYVKFTETGIVHYEICTLCGEEVALSVDDSADAVTVAGKVLNQTSYDAINVTAAGTYTFDVDQATNLQYAYVNGDKVVANAPSNFHNSLANGDKTDGENAFAASVTANVVTVTTEFAGIFIAFVPTNPTRLQTAGTIGMNTYFALESSIAMDVAINTKNIITDFDAYYAVINHQKYEGTTALPVEDFYIYESTPNGTYLRFNYRISAMQMNDEISYRWYGQADGIDYLLRERVNYTLVNYAANQYANVEAKATLKTLLSTLFKYGETAQKYFNYRNVAATLVTANPLIATHYNNFPAAATIAKADIEKMETTGSTHLDSNNKLFGYGRGLNCDSTVEAYFGVKCLDFFKANPQADVSKLTFVVSYIKPEDEATGTFTTDTYTTKNAYKYVESEERYFFASNKIASAMMPSETKIDVYYDGVWQSGCNYTINNYLYSKYDATDPSLFGGTANLGDISKAIATFGATARTYFAS